MSVIVIAGNAEPGGAIRSRRSLGSMRIAVLGATGSMGSRVAEAVRRQGHECVAASRSSGVDAYTGDGLREALDGVEAVIDCMDLMTMNAEKGRDFFGRVAGNVLEAASAAGVRRVVCLSIAGVTDGEVNKRFGYYQAKAEHERSYLEAAGGDATPEVRVLRSTQWFGFPAQAAGQLTAGPVALVPTMVTAPVSEDRVAGLLVELAVGGKAGSAGGDGDERITSVRGPEIGKLRDFIRREQDAVGEVGGKKLRFVLEAPLFGRAVAHGGLVPDEGLVDETTFGSYLESLRG